MKLVSQLSVFCLRISQLLRVRKWENCKREFALNILLSHYDWKLICFSMRNRFSFDFLFKLNRTKKPLLFGIISVFIKSHSIIHSSFTNTSSILLFRFLPFTTIYIIVPITLSFFNLFYSFKSFVLSSFFFISFYISFNFIPFSFLLQLKKKEISMCCYCYCCCYWNFDYNDDRLHFWLHCWDTLCSNLKFPFSCTFTFLLHFGFHFLLVLLYLKLTNFHWLGVFFDGPTLLCFVVSFY